jgi:hypothetical protein
MPSPTACWIDNFCTHCAPCTPRGHYILHVCSAVQCSAMAGSAGSPGAQHSLRSDSRSSLLSPLHGTCRLLPSTWSHHSRGGDINEAGAYAACHFVNDGLLACLLFFFPTGRFMPSLCCFGRTDRVVPGGFPPVRVGRCPVADCFAGT